MTIHQAVDLTVQIPHRLALGLRRVRGEHGLHRDVTQHAEDVILRKAQRQHLPQIFRPQALLSLRPLFFFP
jgi:hypothetical protein